MAYKMQSVGGLSPVGSFGGLTSPRYSQSVQIRPDDTATLSPRQIVQSEASLTAKQEAMQHLSRVDESLSPNKLPKDIKKGRNVSSAQDVVVINLEKRLAIGTAMYGKFTALVKKIHGSKKTSYVDAEELNAYRASRVLPEVDPRYIRGGRVLLSKDILKTMESQIRDYILKTSSALLDDQKKVRKALRERRARLRGPGANNSPVALTRLGAKFIKEVVVPFLDKTVVILEEVDPYTNIGTGNRVRVGQAITKFSAEGHLFVSRNILMQIMSAYINRSPDTLQQNGKILKAIRDQIVAVKIQAENAKQEMEILADPSKEKNRKTNEEIAQIVQKKTQNRKIRKFNNFMEEWLGKPKPEYGYFASVADIVSSVESRKVERPGDGTMVYRTPRSLQIFFSKETVANIHVIWIIGTLIRHSGYDALHRSAQALTEPSPNSQKTSTPVMSAVEYNNGAGTPSGLQTFIQERLVNDETARLMVETGVNRVELSRISAMLKGLKN